MVDIASGRFPLLPVRPLIVDRFDSAAKIGKVAAPVLIVHGERDRTIPVRLARKLYKRAREPKEAVFIPKPTTPTSWTLACLPSCSNSSPATAMYRPKSKHRVMSIEPIKSERDHRRTLEEIETLMTAKRHTPEGDRLDVLATLVEAWEAKNHPLDQPKAAG